MRCARLELAGRLTIGHTERGDDEVVRIELIDDRSCCVAAEAVISLLDYAHAVRGRGFVPCRLFVNMSGAIGKVREHEERLIPRLDLPCTPSDIAAHVAPYEVDGWEAREDDVTNHHRIRGDRVLVTFERWVDPPEHEAREDEP